MIQYQELTSEDIFHPGDEITSHRPYDAPIRWDWSPCTPVLIGKEAFYWTQNSGDELVYTARRPVMVNVAF